VQKLARLVQVDEQIIHSQVLQPTVRRQRQRPSPEDEEELPATVAASDRIHPEPQAHCLAQLLLQPDLLPVLDARCQAIRVEPLDTEDFADVVDQAIFTALLEAEPTEAGSTEQEWHEQLPPPLQERLQQLLHYGATLPSLPTAQAADDLVGVVLRLRLTRLRRRMAELQYLLEQAQEESDGQAVRDYGRLVMQHTSDMGRLHQTLNGLTWSGKRKAS